MQLVYSGSSQWIHEASIPLDQLCHFPYRTRPHVPMENTGLSSALHHPGGQRGVNTQSYTTSCLRPRQNQDVVMFWPLVAMEYQQELEYGYLLLHDGPQIRGTQSNFYIVKSFLSGVPNVFSVLLKHVCLVTDRAT